MKKLLLTLAAGLTVGAALASAAPRVITIGVVAKSQGNPVFQAARVGAQDAAKELSAKHGMDIRIDWRTPNEEDAQKQAESIEQLLLAGVDGIIVSASDANKLNDAINKAAGRGVPVATFSGDAPASKRFVSLGIDDFKCGEQTFEELAKLAAQLQPHVSPDGRRLVFARIDPAVFDQRIEAFGSAGMLQTVNQHNDNVVRTSAADFAAQSPLKYFFLERYAESFALSLAEFVAAVTEGRSASANEVDGRNALVIARACEQSRKEGRVIRPVY